MAFPGTYNFNYYKGDTLEFKVYPKNTDGSAFDLTSYHPSNNGNGAGFTIATARGSDGVNASKVTATATINLSDNSVSCRISPTAGAALDADRQYVYDVEISKGSGNTATVFTLLTGTVTITDQVTGATA